MSDKKSKKYIIFTLQIVSAALLALIDQLIKRAAAGLSGKDDIILIKNFIGLSYAENTGAAFSAFSDSTVFLSAVTLLMLIALAVYLFFSKTDNIFFNIGAAMILGGGTGNIIDRFSQGYVVDYIKTLFVDFPVYNFADILVTCGVAMVCAYLIYDIIKDEKKKRAEKSNGNS